MDYGRSLDQDNAIQATRTMLRKYKEASQSKSEAGVTTNVTIKGMYHYEKLSIHKKITVATANYTTNAEDVHPLMPCLILLVVSVASLKYQSITNNGTAFVGLPYSRAGVKLQLHQKRPEFCMQKPRACIISVLVLIRDTHQHDAQDPSESEVSAGDLAERRASETTRA